MPNLSCLLNAGNIICFSKWLALCTVCRNLGAIALSVSEQESAFE